MKIIAEYIWQDGTKPTHKLRSKTKVLSVESWDGNFPDWTFDGSSTGQAPGDKSDCVLRPVKSILDPTRKGGANAKCYLVLCEVLNSDGTPHETNTRALLRSVTSQVESQKPLFGIEQEYTMFKVGRPFGWPTGGYPPQQGPFYCGVGSDEVFGRELVEEHLAACVEADLPICGVNSEVMPGQWEFQVGPSNPLEISDSLILSRWILYRLGEQHGITVKLDPKPVAELNGAGAHTNFSTEAMRNANGLEHIYDACKKLQERHEYHVENYGHGIESRLTGQHETCSYREFRYGVSDRGASIRIPLHVSQAGRGYLEDRRPCANVDPYVVTRLILETVCC